MKKSMVMLMAALMIFSFEIFAANAKPKGRTETYKKGFHPVESLKKIKKKIRLEKKKNNFKYRRRLDRGVGGPCVGNPYFQNRKA
jgi:hypothetical protein